MENLVHILVPLAGCAMIFGIVYVIATANNRENMAMIQQGMNPKEGVGKSHSKLRIAMLMIFVPIGILIGNRVHTYFGIDAEPAGVIFSFFMGGIALLTTYLIERFAKNSHEE